MLERERESDMFRERKRTTGCLFKREREEGAVWIMI